LAAETHRPPLFSLSIQLAFRAPFSGGEPAEEPSFWPGGQPLQFVDFRPERLPPCGVHPRAIWPRLRPPRTPASSGACFRRSHHFANCRVGHSGAPCRSVDVVPSRSATAKRAPGHESRARFVGVQLAAILTLTATGQCRSVGAVQKVDAANTLFRSLAKKRRRPRGIFVAQPSRQLRFR